MYSGKPFVGDYCQNDDIVVIAMRMFRLFRANRYNPSIPGTSVDICTRAG